MFTSVGWQVTLCNPVLQVMIHSSVMGSLLHSLLRDTYSSNVLNVDKNKRVQPLRGRPLWGRPFS